MDQLASAMSSINEVSPQNVDSTRQAETAAQDLANVGQRLKHLIENYRI
jgi:methyl-accepting chemotaxis protein